MKRENVPCLVRAVRTLNIVTALVQLLAGAGSLTSLLALDVPAALVSAYAVLFAMLLLLYECRLEATDAFLREYFGFLFTYRGLGAFLLIVGILDLGMAGGLFGLVAGATACTNAMVVFFVGCCMPRVSVSSSTDLPTTINSVRAPSYGSAVGTTKGKVSRLLADVTASPAVVRIASSSSSKKKKATKSGSSLCNTTLNV